MTRACSEKRTKSYNYYITLNIWKIQEGQSLVKKPKKVYLPIAQVESKLNRI